MTTIIVIGLIVFAMIFLSWAVNLAWLVFPVAFAGGIWVIVKTLVETGTKEGSQLRKLFEGPCGLAVFVVLLGCIVLL